MPRYVFPAGTLSNSSGAPLRVQFYPSSTGGSPYTDLAYVSAGLPVTNIPNGVIVTDSTGNYAAFAGPEGITSGYLLASNTSTRVAVSANYLAASGSYDVIKGLTNPFYVAHRGGGDDRPEHTLVSYNGAVSAGLQHIELSINLTADNVPICMHDPTYDRTTTATGNINTLTYASLRKNYVVDIGATWPGNWGNEPIPTLKEVLDAVGDRAVLWIEPKNAAATALPYYWNLLGRYPNAKIVWKCASVTTTGGIPTHAKTAQSLGYPVWCYMLTGSETDAAIDLTAQQADLLGVDNSFTTTYISKIVAAAALYGKKAMAYAVHRRWDRDRLLALGIQGIMASSPQYVSTSTPLMTSSVWASGIRAPGELPLNDDTGTMATFDTANRALTINPTSPSNNSVLLGNLCPPKSGATTYTVTFAMRWNTLPTSTLHSDFIICNTDDSQYQHQASTNSGGYHLVIRANGLVQLFKHDPGTTTGTALGTNLQTTVPVAGSWMTFSITVSPTSVTWQRTDDASSAVVVSDTTYRGGYMHIAGANADQAVQFRDVVVS
jgi:glycerophosphoryl diester phosphodiesterase